jgi:regulator of sigma E protease
MIGETIGSIFWFIVAIGVLVTFHEFGHFWVARRCGVRVLRFSVGFGRALWSRKARDGTEYRIAAIPLGGYVKFLDGREDELMPGEERTAFDRQPLWKRVLIVAAGPFANWVLCIALLWVALQVGFPETIPVVGTPSGLAADAGFASGDRLLAVDGKSAETWEQAYTPLVFAAIDHRPVVVSVRDEDGVRHDRTLALDRLPADFDQTNVLRAIGLHPLAAQDRPVVGSVSEGQPASGVLQPGDEIVAIDSQPIRAYSDIPPRVQAVAAPGKALRVEVRREGSLRSFGITPRQFEQGGKTSWVLGIKPAEPAPVEVRFAAVPAVGEAWRRTGAMFQDTFALIGRLLSGKASSQHVSGVVGIARGANAQARLGPGRLLAYMAALSLALCVMNLLPIPVLDGGHLLYYLIELVSGRPLSDRVLIAGQYVGLALLAGLITLALYNDMH